MKPFTVLVPCSTSNLGAGFDAVGIALSGPDLMVRVTPGGEGLRIARLSGEGADRLAPDSTNRVIDAAYRAAAAAGRSRQPLAAELSIHSSIPLKRGLGSSAAAALAGGLLADALLDGAIGQEVLLRTAVEMEGHPDNVVPALRGGAQVTLADAVHNLGRAALLVAALGAGRLELLAEAMDDRLHQPARAGLLPWLPPLLAAARKGGAFGAALSGAGTTVCALCSAGAAREVARAMMDAAASLGVAGRSEVVDVAVPGARVVLG